MFEGFAYIAVALIGGWGALTGFLPSMLIALFGDRSVLTVSQNSGLGIPSLLNPSGGPQPKSPPGHVPGEPGGGLIAGLTGVTTGYTPSSGSSYTGEPLGPGGPVISGTQSGGNQEVQA